MYLHVGYELSTELCLQQRVLFITAHVDEFENTSPSMWSRRALCFHITLEVHNKLTDKYFWAIDPCTDSSLFSRQADTVDFPCDAQRLSKYLRKCVAQSEQHKLRHSESWSIKSKMIHRCTWLTPRFTWDQEWLRDCSHRHTHTHTLERSESQWDSMRQTSLVKGERKTSSLWLCQDKQNTEHSGTTSAACF